MLADKLIQDKGRHHWVCSSWKRETETDREWETERQEREGKGREMGVERQEGVSMKFWLPGGYLCMKRWHWGLSQLYICSAVMDNRVFASFLSVCAKSRLCKASSWTSLRTPVPMPSSWYQYWFSVSSTVEWCQMYDWSKFLLPRQLGITFLFCEMC